MKNNQKSLDKTIKGITSGWVSLSKDYKKVIAHARTLNELAKKLEKKGNPDGYVMKASADFSSYVGHETNTSKFFN